MNEERIERRIKSMNDCRWRVVGKYRYSMVPECDHPSERGSICKECGSVKIVDGFPDYCPLERALPKEKERGCRTCYYQYFEEPDPCANCLDANDDSETSHNWKWDGIRRKKRRNRLSEHDRDTVERTEIAIIKEAFKKLSEEKKVTNDE